MVKRIIKGENKMLEFKLLDYKLNEEIYVKDNSLVYILEKDHQIIGYGFLNNKKKNKIEILIKDEYQSNGYGKVLFEKMLEELKEIGDRDVKLTISKDNYKIKNIIKLFNGILLSNYNGKEEYLIPLV